MPKFPISGDKLEVMMSLRDEVEQEYAERMTELRDMYKEEMDVQSDNFTADKQRLQVLEHSLQVSWKLQWSKFYPIFAEPT